MSKTIIVITAAALAVHGLVHLMGMVAYLRLAEIDGLPYKTTLLGGRVELGPLAMSAFGALWVLPVVGFLAAAFGMVWGYDWWRPMLIAAALLSLSLTALDWKVAFRGGLIDIAILAALAVGPRVSQILR